MKKDKHNLDYPYLSLPDIDENEVLNEEKYPLGKQNFEHEIRDLYDK